MAENSEQLEVSLREIAKIKPKIEFENKFFESEKKLTELKREFQKISDKNQGFITENQNSTQTIANQ